MRVLPILALLSVLVFLPKSSAGEGRIIREIPHDSHAFTEGLVVQGGVLYESTGLNGSSSLRKIDLTTGRILKKNPLDPHEFAEGITFFKGALYQLTWTSEHGYIYDPRTLERTGTFKYSGQGWGLTHDNNALIMSNGTNELRYFEPRATGTIRSIQVHWADGSPVTGLNSLEYAHGEILANVYYWDKIIRIDPSTGLVKGQIDLSEITAQSQHGDPYKVLNGIAYDPARDDLIVSGKDWDRAFEIEFS